MEKMQLPNHRQDNGSENSRNYKGKTAHGTAQITDLIGPAGAHNMGRGTEGGTLSDGVINMQKFT